MPEVPEIPGVVPQVQPFERPVPLPGVAAPPAAFGAATANAIRTFGGDVEKASGEVFSRAMALRQLQVDGKIRDLTTQYYQEVAPIQADFRSQEGERAGPDAMNAHLAQLEGVRQKYAKLADQYGPYGRNMFGNEAASLQRNFIIHATDWSAAQSRAAIKNSFAGRLHLLTQSWRDPTNNDEYNDKAKEGADLIRQTGAMEGTPRSKVEANIADWNRDLRIEQIYTLAGDHPQDALKLLNENKEQLGDKRNQVREHVWNQVKKINGDNLADNIEGEWRKTGGSVQEAVEKGRKAVEDDPNLRDVPGLATHVDQSIRAKIRGTNFDQQQDDNRNEQAILEAMMKPGANYTSLADLEADNPEIKAVENQLRSSKRGLLFLSGLDRKIQHDWTARHTEQMKNNMIQLWGESQSPDPRIRQQFLDHTADFHEFELSKPDTIKLITRRGQLISHPDDDNRILRHALQVARDREGTALHTLHIDKYTDDYKDIYHRWTGTLAIAVDEWMNRNDHKHPNDQQLLDEIIKPSIKQRSEGGLGWLGIPIGQRQRGAFDFDLPAEDLAKWKQLEAERLRKAYGQDIDPKSVNDEDAYFAAAREMYNKFYSKRKE